MAMIYLWPIITLIGLLIYKYALMGFAQPYYMEICGDLLLLFIICILSIKRQSRFGRHTFLLITLFILFYHWLDTCIILAINNRLTLDNFLANYSNYSAFIYVINTKLIVFTALAILVPILVRKRTLTFRFSTVALTTIFVELLILVAIIYYFLPSNSLASGNAIDLMTDSLTANQVNQKSLQYVEDKFPTLIQRINQYLAGKQWQVSSAHNNKKPNIILVISESLSAVDSKYDGGLFDRLPLIDKMQQDGVAITNAVSSGKISIQGLAGILLGAQSTKTGGFASALKQFPPDKLTQNNIIAYANKAGYKTIMIEPGQPPNWFEMTRWFKGIGFNNVIARDSVFFANTPRFTWDTPSDEAMYHLAEQLSAQQKEPYLIAIQTMSLHPSYILPDSKYKIGNSDLLNLINYVDGTTYAFYQNLKKSDYFKNGVLVVVGDHRRFEPLEAAEIKDGGYAKWHERIVCSLVGKGIATHTLASTPFNSVDLNTLLHYVIDGAKVDAHTIARANISALLGIEKPISIALVNESRGGYLIRSENYPPLFISIYGNIPFDQVPSLAYRQVIPYLILNDQRMKTVMTK